MGEWGGEGVFQTNSRTVHCSLASMPLPVVESNISAANCMTTTNPCPRSWSRPHNPDTPPLPVQHQSIPSHARRRRNSFTPAESKAHVRRAGERWREAAPAWRTWRGWRVR
jgi:hypothetical protein